MQPVYRPEMLELADRYLEPLRAPRLPAPPKPRRMRRAAGRMLVRIGQRLAAAPAPTVATR
jgi:hypothetical protein